MARTLDGNIANYFSTTLKYDLPTNCTICWAAKTSDSSSSMAVMGRRDSAFGAGAGAGFHVARPGSDIVRSSFFNGFNSDSASATWPADGAWHYFVITKSGTSLTFYRDTTASRGTATATYTNEASYNLMIGAFHNTGVPAWNMNGSLAEIALFSRVLDATDIGLYMGGTAPTSYDTSLDHYWKMDETSGNCAATVGGVTLTLVGASGTETHPTGIGGGSTIGAAAHYYRQMQ